MQWLFNANSASPSRLSIDIAEIWCILIAGEFRLPGDGALSFLGYTNPQKRAVCISRTSQKNGH